MIVVPAADDGRPMDEQVIYDAVGAAIAAAPGLGIRPDIEARLGALVDVMLAGEPARSNKTYGAAIKLAGAVLRFAWDNRPSCPHPGETP